MEIILDFGTDVHNAILKVAVTMLHLIIIACYSLNSNSFISFKRFKDNIKPTLLSSSSVTVLISGNCHVCTYIR